MGEKTVTQSEERRSVSEHIWQKAGWTWNVLRRFINPNLTFNAGIREVVDQMMKSNMLDGDDLEFVQKMTSLSEVSSYRLLLGKAIVELALAVLPSVISSLMKSMKTCGKCFSSVALPLVIFRWHRMILYSLDLKKMKNLLEVTVKLDKTVKKALRAIVFCNSINQGYLMTREVYQIQNLEASEIKELALRSRGILPGLRIILHRSSRRVAAEFSRIAYKLIVEGPLPSNLVDDSFFVSNFSDEISDDDSMWLKLKDGRGDDICIPTVRELKNAVDIFRLKKSIYFKVVVLCAIVKKSTSEISYIQPLYRVVMDAMQEIDEALCLHNRFLMNPITGVHLCKEYNFLEFDFCKSVTTCSLHLQEALFESWKLEDSLLHSSLSKSSQNMEEFTEASSRLMHHLVFAKKCIRQSKKLYSLINSTLSIKGDNVCNEDNQELNSSQGEFSFNEFISKDEIIRFYFADDLRLKAS